LSQVLDWRTADSDGAVQFVQILTQSNFLTKAAPYALGLLKCLGIQSSTLNPAEEAQ